jgi:hypothetical protein
MFGEPRALLHQIGVDHDFAAIADVKCDALSLAEKWCSEQNSQQHRKTCPHIASSVRDDALYCGSFATSAVASMLTPF